MRFILTTTLLLSFGAHAAGINPPDSVAYNDKTYTLVFKNDNKRAAIYEYTTDGEAIEKWKTLVTINYHYGAAPDKMLWAKAVKQTLDSQSPVPHYKMFLNEDQLYINTIYEPNAAHNYYEINVQRSYLRDTCGGWYVVQYAEKYDLEKSGEDKRAYLLAMVYKLNLATEQLKTQELKLGC